MTLTQTDLKSIRQLIDDALEIKLEEKIPPLLYRHVPKIVQPMFDDLNRNISDAFDETQSRINLLRDDVDGIKHGLKYVKVAVHRLEVRGTLKT